MLTLEAAGLQHMTQRCTWACAGLGIGTLPHTRIVCQDRAFQLNHLKPAAGIEPIGNLYNRCVLGQRPTASSKPWSLMALS